MITHHEFNFCPYCTAVTTTSHGGHFKFYKFPLSQAAHFDEINVGHPYEDQNVNE